MVVFLRWRMSSLRQIDPHALGGSRFLEENYACFPRIDFSFLLGSTYTTTNFTLHQIETMPGSGETDRPRTKHLPNNSQTVQDPGSLSRGKCVSTLKIILNLLKTFFQFYVVIIDTWELHIFKVYNLLFFLFRPIPAAYGSLGQGSYWSYSCQPMPQPQQHRGLEASCVPCTAARGNARSLTH